MTPTDGPGVRTPACYSLRRFAGILLAVSTALIAGPGCVGSKGASPVRPGAHTVKIGGVDVVVEIAADSERRMRGLMYRDGLEEDHGMLFIFPEPQPQAFYMKNCRFDIDIAYIDDAGKIVKTYTMKHYPAGYGGPYDYYRCEVPVRYVLEVDGGWLAAHGVKVGDVVTGHEGPPSVVPR